MEKKNGKTRHRKYDAHFKEEALKQVENGQRIASVAQALGISEALLYSWRKRTTSSTVGGSGEEVSLLRKQVKQLEMERDILKKALTIFGRQP